MTKVVHFLVFSFCLFFLTSFVNAAPSNELLLSCQIPYYLGKPRGTVLPGEQIQAFFNIENLGVQHKEVTATIYIPAEFTPDFSQKNWQITSIGTEYCLQRQIALDGGYSHWFDLVSLTVNPSAAAGIYPVRIQAGDQTEQLMIQVASEKQAIATIPTIPFTMDTIILPLDKDGKQDDRLDSSTIVLRDRQWDYYKNVLQGKGASNQEMEAIHPVTHMGVDFINPSGQERLIVITTILLDANKRTPVPGLFTPGTTSENGEAGAFGGNENSLISFAALTGEVNQRIRLPIYADEQFFNGSGEYILQVAATSAQGEVAAKEIPVKIIKQDSRSVVVVFLSLLLLLSSLIWSVFHFRRLLQSFRTRWLVTVALFGGAAFTVVNVPSTLLGEFFHVLLGPFGFLISGLFSSVFLYMIVISLVVLIPQPGVIALITVIRMFLGILAFGQFSPILIISYGIHALLLEGFLYGSGIYKLLQSQQASDQLSKRLMSSLLLVCAITDCLALYVSLQATTLLYRMYYASWYIELLLLMNGIIYTSIGTACGVLLGKKLSKIGGD